MRSDLMTKVAARFGYGDIRTRKFFELCESIPNNCLGNALLQMEYESIISESIWSEE